MYDDAANALINLNFSIIVIHHILSHLVLHVLVSCPSDCFA